MKSKHTRKMHRTFSEAIEARTMLSSTISFASHVDFAVGTSPVALVAADFNADGNQDLAVADNVTDKVYVFFGNGQGAFTAGPVLSLSAPPTAVITGDFNGDGKPDLAVAATAGVGQSTTSVDIFLNTGGGTFGVGEITTVETGATAGESVALTAADFNRDGHLDLAVTEFTRQSVDILFGNGNGTFASPINYQANANPTAITEADFNNDTYPDIAITSTTTDSTSGTAFTTNDVSLLLNSAGGNFSAGPNIQITSSGIPTSVTPANLTGATTPGLIVGDSNGNATVLTNTAGNFNTSAGVSLGAGSTALATADFDLDGNTDFVSSDGGSATSTTDNAVTVVQGAGNGSISNSYSFVTGSHPADVVIADFNNDGKPDLATANELGGTASILLNNTGIPPIVTKTVIALSSASTPAGSTVTVTATITAASASPLNNEEVPTGTVNFFDGSTLLSTVTLTAGATQAVFSTTNLTIGAHNLHANYSGDDAYALSKSAGSAETIAPTATEGPDLVGTYLLGSLPPIVAPGESGTITIQVTNQGNTIASGVITDQASLSLTPTPGDSTAITIRGSLGRTVVRLKPGKSVTLRGTITIPQTLAPGSYYILTQLDATGSLPESVSTNDLVTSTSTYSVQDVFGTVSGRRNVALKIADSTGAVGTFQLIGPGEGTVAVTPAGVDVTLSGTTAASTVLLASGRAVYHVQNLSTDNAVGTLRLPTAAISGAVTIASTAKSIAARSFAAGSSLSVTTIKTLSISGAFASTVTAQSIGSLAFHGGAFNTMIDAASTIGSILIAGNFSASTILTGINQAGSIASLRVTGAATAVLVGSGVTTDSSGRVTALRSDGLLRSVSITGPVDFASRFVAAVLPKRAVLDRVAVNPATDPQFQLES